MSEKLELLLNASLEATPEEREKSGILQTGFDSLNRTWEVIVKYHGRTACRICYIDGTRIEDGAFVRN